MTKHQDNSLVQDGNYNKKINWMNFTKSFFMAVCVFVLQLSVSIALSFYTKDDMLVDTVNKGVILFIAAIVARMAYVYETGKYDKCFSFYILGILTYLFCAIGVWATAYQILQIKNGNIQPVPEKAKK